MRLFENAYVSLSLDERVPCLEWTGKKFIPSAEFRHSEKIYLQYYLQYQPYYPNLQLFVDARLIGAISPEDTQWLAEIMLPQFVKAGVTKEAFWVTKVLTQMSVKQYKAEVGKLAKIAIFDTVEAAKIWLKE
jgi:hypothetical protein